MTKPKVLVLGEAFPLTGGIASVIQAQFNSPLSKLFQLILFDTRKRTRANRTIVEGAAAQLFLLMTYLVKMLMIRPNVVHIHAGGGSDIFRKGWDVNLARFCGRFVVLHIHGGDFDQFFNPENRQQLEKIRRIFRRCNAVVALSEYWKSLYVRLLDEKAVHVVNNCVDLESYRSLNKEAARRALELPNDAPVVLHLGAQGKRKGTFDLVRSVPHVLEEVPETRFILVGPDEDVHPGAIEEGESLAKELGVSHAVRFLGPRTGTQKSDCLAAADLFVLPSYNENFPISILEAMACRLPVVSTNVGGIPEILRDTPAENVVEPGDIKALASRISMYVSNPSARREAGDRNLAFAESRFNNNVFAQRLKETYEAVCG